MNELEAYKAVNATETLDELAEVILEIGDNPMRVIQGRRRSFNAIKTALYCRDIGTLYPWTSLTRNYGIRQQAYYIFNLDGID